MHARPILVALLLLPASTLAQARIVVQPPSIRVEIAPPAAIVEAPPPAPSSQHVWTAGYWGFRDGRHVWVPGTYVVAPQPGARWVPARWVSANGGWYLEQGHWVTVAQPRPMPAPPAPPAYPPPAPQAYPQPQPYPPPQPQAYPPPPAYPPPQPPAYAPPPPPRGPPQRIPAVLNAREIHAEVVRARIIYATEVKAADGRVGTVVKLRGKPPKMKGGPEIEQREVVADTIYAKEIKARWIEAQEIHAKEVEIGRH